ITPGELVQVPRQPPAIAALALYEAGAHLTVQLRGGDARTRVHVIATRFVPALVEPLGEGPLTMPSRRADRLPGARYVSGRELGDEYRYVLERRAAPRFPGLLLDKPSLLLNPWSRRTTTTEIAPPRPGGVFAAAPAAMASWGESRASLGGPLAATDESFVAYDFLPAA